MKSVVPNAEFGSTPRPADNQHRTAIVITALSTELWKLAEK